MQSTINKLKCDLILAMTDAKEMQSAARIGLAAGMVLGFSPAWAQGFIRGFENLNTLSQVGTTLLISLGLLGGLGMILGGCFSAYKKYDRGNDDVTWGKIGMQIAAGGSAMALGWVGVNVVETLGGSQSDIGRQISR